MTNPEPREVFFVKLAFGDSESILGVFDNQAEAVKTVTDYNQLIKRVANVKAGNKPDSDGSTNVNDIFTYESERADLYISSIQANRPVVLPVLFYLGYASTVEESLRGFKGIASLLLNVYTGNDLFYSVHRSLMPDVETLKRVASNENSVEAFEKTGYSHRVIDDRSFMVEVPVQLLISTNKEALLAAL